MPEHHETETGGKRSPECHSKEGLRGTCKQVTHAVSDCSLSFGNDLLCLDAEGRRHWAKQIREHWNTQLEASQA